MKGIGIHVFAGGFTMGMKQVHDIVGQLEIHNFGRQTCEAHDTKFMNADSWQAWADFKSTYKDCSFCYGNPRCTAFSSYSSGSDRTVRGPTAKPTRDIWDLCEFGIHNNLDLIAFESVQQAFSIGKQLLNILRDDLFVPNGYRIAHLFVNTAAEGNAQKRRRYFFVAYKKNRNFNIIPPVLPKFRVTVGDILKPLMKRKVHEGKVYGKSNLDYTQDTYVNLTPTEKILVPHLGQGDDFNSFAMHNEDDLEKISPEHYEKWITRTSGIPFSLHCPTRLKIDGHCPTICSTSARLIHHILPRPLTVGEIAKLMGWPKGFIPVGPDPVGQIGKGVVPATGQWLGEQIKLYFENAWGDEDFESRYCGRCDAWIGNEYQKTNRPVEKIFNLTNYLPPFREN